MNPRGEQKSMQPEEKPVSADEVQAEGAPEPVSDAQEGVETPPSLEVESVQLLENPENRNEEQENLARMLLESAERGKARDEERLAHAIHTFGKEETLQLKTAPDLSPEAVIHAIETDEEERHAPGGYDIQFDEAMQRRKASQNLAALAGPGPVFLSIGQQDNGDFGVVVTVPEFFVESCKQFAEADGGKTLEQWCTEFFIMNLEAYCTPNKGR